jgi:hypothetical protein
MGKRQPVKAAPIQPQDAVATTTVEGGEVDSSAPNDGAAAACGNDAGEDSSLPDTAAGAEPSSTVEETVFTKPREILTDEQRMNELASELQRAECIAETLDQIKVDLTIPV